MDDLTTGLARFAQTLPSEWKWMALYGIPGEYEGEWSSWLAAAQRAEEDALLSFWAHRQDIAA